MNNKTNVVLSSLFDSSSQKTSTIKAFLKELYKDCYKRSGKVMDKYTFHEITNFPLIISEKIFYHLNTSKTLSLSLGEFTTGIFDLYYGSLDTKINFLFRICDFDNDNIIHIEDVKLIFSFFHMINLTINTEPSLMNIINRFFDGHFGMDASAFSATVHSEKNYDLIFLLVVFIRKFSFFTEDQIEYYEKNNSESLSGEEEELKGKIEVDVDDDVDIVSDECYDYAIMVSQSTATPPIETDEEDLDALNELDDFENDIGCTMEGFTNVKGETGSVQSDDIEGEDTKNGYEKKLTNFFTNNTKNKGPNRNTIYTMNNNKIPSGSINMMLHSNKFLTCTTPVNKALLNSNTTTSVIDFFPNHNVLEYKLFTLKKSLKVSKCKLVLINNGLFYFKWHPTNNYYYLKHYYILSGLFPKVENQIVIDKMVYTPLLLVSTLHNYKRTKTFLSKTPSDVKTLFEGIVSNANIKKVDDYYKFGPEIGKGKFGKVNIGVSIGSSEKVAIKIVSKYNITTTTSKEDYTIMKWEMDIFKYLKHARHPNIITCLNIFETSSYIYYIYEYMNTGTLKAYLKNFVVDAKTMVDIVLQLLKGVSFLHTHGIIHRDIKHTNIMINSDENKKVTAKIIDFGLSRVLGRYEECGDPYGSLSFQAPEMLLGQTYNFKVDVWSLGVTVYYIVYKQLPFEESTGEKVRDNILYHDYSLAPIENLDSAGKNEIVFVFSLICDCLTKEREKRPDIFEIIRTYFKTNTSSIHNSNTVITTNTSNINSSIKLK